MCDFRGYYGKHKRKKEVVGQKIVGHSIKTSVRLDGDNHKFIQEKVNYINSLSDMKTDFSKTLNNILSDIILDEKLEQQKFELEGIDD